MIRVQLYRVLPSDTWAFAYRVPGHENIVGLLPGYKTRESAQSGELYLSQRLEMQLEFAP